MFETINVIWKKNNGQQNTAKYDKDQQIKIYILPMFCIHKNFYQNRHRQ